MAAGMAKQVLIPVFAVYSSFLQRAYDMLLHDVSLQKLHVVFCVDRAGIVGSDGETHNGVFDLAYLSTVPGMTILCPASFAELRSMLKMAIYDMEGPVAIRYPRGGESLYTEENTGHEALLREGDALTIVSYGTMINNVLAAADLLEEKGIRCDVIKIGMAAPLKTEQIMASLQKTGFFLMAEDVCAPGCLGEKILARAEQMSISLKGSRLLNLGEGILPHGSVKELMQACGLDEAGIVRSALNLLGREKEKHE